jgi:hypothetical protein
VNGYVLAALVGVLAGLHSASWGMFKDAPHEGFTWAKYLRSPVLSGIAAPILHGLSGLDLESAGGIAVFFGFVYIVERAILEYYKTFLREEDQSKYFIPMQFHVFGEVVEARARRLLVGPSYLLAVLAVLAWVWWLDRQRTGLPGWATVLALGSVGGWVSAFGGAWKDVGHFTSSYVLLVGAATGYTVATIETYKTFFFPNEPRGKFAGMPVHFPEMLGKRKLVVPLYVAIWLFVLASFAIAFAAPHEGLVRFI